MKPIETIIDLLEFRSRESRDKVAYRFLEDGEFESDSSTYRSLYFRSQIMASEIAKIAKPGERVVLLFPSGIHFIEAFLGCLLVGVIAVPVNPPSSKRRLGRIKNIINDCESVGVISISRLYDKFAKWMGSSKILNETSLLLVDKINEKGKLNDLIRPSVEDIAFLQYTSGSTGNPKGVMVSHDNIMHNCGLLKGFLQLEENTIHLGWLPVFHDMGLMGNILSTLYSGCTLVFMPPVSFIRKPICWLKAITKYKATVTGGPNFSYDFCVENIKENALENIDLSSCKVYFNGAEPIKANTILEFVEKFSKYGMKHEYFKPCYGMAETTLVVSGFDSSTDSSKDTLKTKCLDSLKNKLPISTGGALNDTEVVIIDTNTKKACKENEEGEIWVKGLSVAKGYWNKPLLNKEIFNAFYHESVNNLRGPFLKTGDLGFLSNGEIHISGRLKEMMIFNGKNVYPQDIEVIVQNSSKDFKTNSGAIFSIGVNGKERLIVTQEIKRTSLKTYKKEDLFKAIREEIFKEFDLQVLDIFILKPGTIPVTSSGKIKRGQCKEWYLKREFPGVLNILLNEKKNDKTSTSKVNLNIKVQKSKDYIEFVDWIKEKIAKLISKPVTHINKYDSFSELGLSSIQMIRLTGELSDYFKREISPAELYDFSTIEKITHYLLLAGKDVKKETIVEVKEVKEQIAIIGVSCRFPEANNINEFWSNLIEGVDSVKKISEERKNFNKSYRNEEVFDKKYVQFGGYIDDIDKFDSKFFGITPTEAKCLDPQHRILMELAQEVIEDAGYLPKKLKGTKTGVYLGISHSDYWDILKRSEKETELFASTGNSLSMAANRISYFYDIKGPSMAIDTACSSSLTAIHMATQGIIDGACTMAIAGGVNLVLSPEVNLNLAKANFLSKDGSCKTFDKSANGYVRGEGCGLILLKSLSKAQSDGDNILGVIRGSAIIQDGKSNGLTAPNGLSQQEVIREALSNANVKANEVSYVEAHGTGTELGDPIEVHALNNVYNVGRFKNEPLKIGSVKANIGHLESAAGIAGLIKAMLCLKNRQIPKQIHFNNPNPYIKWKEINVEVVSNNSLLDVKDDKPLKAGVSSFGFGGTNVHLILEEPPFSEPRSLSNSIGQRDTQLVVVSGIEELAIENQRKTLLNFLDHNKELKVTNIAYSKAITKSHLPYRFSFLAENKKELREKLKEGALDVNKTSLSVKSGKIAFMFSGQGSQYPGMGEELYLKEPVFREAFDDCIKFLSPHLNENLLEVIFSKEQKKQVLIRETIYAQPTLFALEYSLCKLWESWGVIPDMVIGHSVGEITAAAVVGVFSLKDAAMLIAVRGKLMESLPKEGSMASINSDVTEVRKAINGFEKHVSISGENSPSQVIISGNKSVIEKICDDLNKKGIKSRYLKVSHAFHSPLMEPILDQFREALLNINFQTPKLKLVSTLTGKIAGSEILSSDYWVSHIRESVKFSEGMTTLSSMGVKTYLEVGPGSVLMSLGKQNLKDYKDKLWLVSLKKGEKEQKSLLQSLSEWYAQGGDVEWESFYKNREVEKISLPSYSFKKEIFWIDDQIDAIDKSIQNNEVDPLKEVIEKGGGKALRKLLESSNIDMTKDLQKAIPEFAETLSNYYKKTKLFDKVDSMLYRPIWELKKIKGKLSTDDNLLVLSDDNDLTEQINKLVKSYKGNIISFNIRDVLGREFSNIEEKENFIYHKLTNCYSGVKSDFTKVVCLWGTELQNVDSKNNFEKVNENLLSIVYALKALKKLSKEKTLPVFFVTQGAIKVDNKDLVYNPDQAVIWALAKVFTLEHPKYWGGIIDLPIKPVQQDFVKLMSYTNSNVLEDHIAIRDNNTYVKRIISNPKLSENNEIWKTSGTAIITGGCGFLGVNAANWLAGKGIDHIILLSRRGHISKEVKLSIDSIQTSGTKISIVKADVCDKNRMNEVISQIKSLKVVVHAAGSIEAELIEDFTYKSFQKNFKAKVLGLKILEELTIDKDLDAFINYSSISSVWGAESLLSYAMANSYLDSWSSFQYQKGIPAYVVNWGPWEGGGMVSLDDKKNLKKIGLNTLDVDSALGGLDTMLSNNIQQLIFADVKWNRFKQIYESLGRCLLFDKVGNEIKNKKLIKSDKNEFVESLKNLDVKIQHKLLSDWLQKELSKILDINDYKTIDKTIGLADSGLDSLLAIAYTESISKELGIELSVPSIITTPNIISLTSYVLDELSLNGNIESEDIKLGEMTTYEKDSIAIVGVSCRLPGGVKDLESLQNLLKEERDTVIQIPKERIDISKFYDPDPNAKGKMYTKYASFIDKHDEFDAAFFGISPREAKKMDPLQRFLLECSWEALENAGINNEKLSKNRVGVFVGIGDGDYGMLQDNGEENLDLYKITGTQKSFSVGRISYLLGVNGPSMAIDTACSSSLVALDLGCKSLQSGESDLIITGSAQMLISPLPFVSLSQSKALANDGRCKTFSNNADGYGRGEGCIVFALRRLSDAIKNEENILGVIKGSAVNHNGMSSGLTVPNGSAQEKVIQDALKNAGLDPGDISYVEAHGTGTNLGDPIEINSLENVYGKNRENTPLFVGSIKSNIGHLEAASGLAGMIKVIAAFQNNELPKSLHCDRLNEHIPWNEFSISVLQESKSWIRKEKPRVAGVSSFGLSGTNAHVIIEEPPVINKKISKDNKKNIRSTQLIVFSGVEQEAVNEQLINLSDYLKEKSDLSVEEIAYNLGLNRNHFRIRTSFLVDSKEELMRKLRGNSINVSRANSLTKNNKIAFLFTGHGSQYYGMCRQLYDGEQVFKKIIDQCDKIIISLAGFSLLEVIFGEDKNKLEQMKFAQPALFSVGYAIFRLWKSWGINPDVILGHSLGEIIAACAAEVFTLEEGLALVVSRGELLQRSSPNCAMVSVELHSENVQGFLLGYEDKVSIAAINGSDQTVISGDLDSIDQILKAFDEKGFKTKRLEVSRASHSPLMDPILSSFEGVIEKINFKLPKYKFINCLEGKITGDEICKPKYWLDHLRKPVQFEKGMQALESFKIDTFLEIGTTPILAGMGSKIIAYNNKELWLKSIWLPSLRKKYDDYEIILSSLSNLYTNGYDIDWESFYKGREQKNVLLPNYPFQRKKYWKNIKINSQEFNDIDIKQLASKANNSKEINMINIKEKLQEIIIQTLHLEKDQLKEEDSLMELGADSLMLMEIIKKIEIEFGIKLDISKLFEELSDINSLTSFIYKEQGDQTNKVIPKNDNFNENTSRTYLEPISIGIQESVGDGVGTLISQFREQNKILLDQFQQQNELLLMYKGKAVIQEKQLPTNDIIDTSQNINKIYTSDEKSNIEGGAIKPFEGIKEIKRVKISEDKKVNLEKLTKEYNKRTKTSKEITELYRDVLADNRASAGFRLSTKEMKYPIISDRAEGAKIWDVDGNEYVDVTMGFGSSLFGHQQDFIVKAIGDQLNKGMHIGPQSHLSGEVAKLISDLTGFERVCFANTGTEAIMISLRLVKSITKKNKIVIFKGSYHGHFDGILGEQGRDKLKANPIASGISENTIKDLMVLDFNSKESVDIIAQFSDEIAGVLIEPVRSRFPDVEPEKDWLTSLREVTRDNDIPLIFDEIITGFRILPGGAQEYFGVKADITTYGKIIGGGMPLGVVAGDSKYLNAVDGGLWKYGDDSYPSTVPTFLAGTFTKHPLTLSASKAILTKIKSIGYYEYYSLNERTKKFVNRLNKFFKEYSLPVTVACFGSQFKFKFNKNFELFFYNLLNNGIYIWEGRICYFSFSHTQDDIDKVYWAIVNSIIKQEGLINNSKTIVPAPTQKQYPILSGQKSMWILEEMNPELLAYNMTSVHRLKGQLSRGSLRKAFEGIVKRHEILRTKFNNINGEVVQSIIENSAFPFDQAYEEINLVKKKINTQQLDEIINERVNRGFDLMNAPLIHFTLVLLKNEEALLIISMHHIISDGWSLGVIINEWIQLYSAYTKNEKSSLSELNIQYKDYAVWYESYLKSDEAKNDRIYWKKELSDNKPSTLELRTDYERSEKRLYKGTTKKFRIDDKSYEELVKYSKKNNVTPFITLLAITKILLYKYSGQKDIVIGTPIANRGLSNLDMQIGYYLNMLILRNKFDENAIFKDFLVNVKTNTINAYKHRLYPYEKIVEEFGTDNSKARNPFYDVLIVLDTLGNQNQNINIISEVTSSTLKIDDELTMEPYEIDYGISKLDLTFFFTLGENLDINIEYRTDLFKEETISKMADDFQKLLMLVLNNSALSIQEVKTKIMSETELNDYNKYKSNVVSKLNDEF